VYFLSKRLLFSVPSLPFDPSPGPSPSSISPHFYKLLSLEPKMCLFSRWLIPRFALYQPYPAGVFPRLGFRLDPEFALVKILFVIYSYPFQFFFFWIRILKFTFLRLTGNPFPGHRTPSSTLVSRSKTLSSFPVSCQEEIPQQYSARLWHGRLRNPGYIRSVCFFPTDLLSLKMVSYLMIFLMSNPDTSF